MALADLSPDTRIYLRPVDFVDAPQLAGRDCERLAGGLIWFASVELWAIAPGASMPVRHHIPLDRWEETHDALPEALQERAAHLFANLTRTHAPMSLGERMLRFDAPQVMGIVNMTPDSFSDGGEKADAGAGAQIAREMVADGAAIIDIGGESTRPGAPLIWEGDEIGRVVPLIEQLAPSALAISIDTRKAAVMEAALAAGAHMINDISALAYDDRAIEVAAACDAPICIMHASSQSSDPHRDPHYAHVVTDIFDWLETRISELEAAGIARGRLIVDPGLGFGKSLADNLAIMNALALFHGLGCPLLVGASRKRMIGALSNEAEASKRLGGSIHLADSAIAAGAHIIRVHDVFETVQAIRTWRGLRDAALTEPPPD